MSLLDNHLQLLAHQADEAAAAMEKRGDSISSYRVEELVRLSLAFYRETLCQAETICPADAWTEEGAREAARLFERWFALATKVRKHIADAEKMNIVVPKKDEFIFAYLASKHAIDIEGIIQRQRKWLRGDKSGYQPFDFKEERR